MAAVLVDAHAHLTRPEFAPDLPLVIERARQAGVVAIVCAGHDLASSRAAVALAAQYPEVYATVGVHPNDVARAEADWREQIAALARAPRVVAIGETGLDFYRDRTPAEAQFAALEWHADLAEELGLPLVVHNRQADAELRRRLLPRGARRPPGTVGLLHCFMGDETLLEEALGLGWHVSIGGPITYRQNARLAEVARAVPSHRLLVETDSPYLSPEPLRGRRNEPANLALVARRLAELRGATLEELATASTAAAARLFGLALPPP